MNERLVEHELRIEANDDARRWLSKHGYDPEYGARPIRRLVQQVIEDRLSDMMLSGRFGAGDTILVDVDEEEDDIVLRRLGSLFNDEPESLVESIPAI